LVVADADAVQQVTHPARRVGDVKSLLDPVADRLRGQEAARSDVGLELLDLDRAELADTAPILEGTESVQTLGAVETKPLADLPRGDAEEFGDLVLRTAVGGPEDGRQSLSHPLVRGLTATMLDLLTLRWVQQQCHSNPQG